MWCLHVGMGKGPGLFSEIGKKSKDLLYRDFINDHKLSLTTCTSTGVAFTSTGVKKGEDFLCDITAKLQKDNVTADVKLDTNSNVLATVTWNEAAPGLKTILNFTVPDQRSGKVEVQYVHDYAGVSTSIGLIPAPLTEFSGVIGSKEFALGGEVAFDTAAGNLTKYNAGMSFTKPDFAASLLLADRGDTVKFSYIHLLSPLTSSTVAAEIAHSFSKKENSFTVGGLYMLDPLTSVKAKVNHHGKVAGLIQHEWQPKSFVTISGEVDTRMLERSSKVGLSLSLNP